MRVGKCSPVEFLDLRTFGDILFSGVQDAPCPREGLSPPGWCVKNQGS